MSNYEKELDEEIDLREIVKIWKKHLSLIVGIVAGVTLITIIYSIVTPRIYEAKAILRIGRAGNSLLESAEEVSQIITSIPYLQKIGQQMSGKPVDEKRAQKFSDSIKITRNGSLLVLATLGKSPEEAERLGKIVSKIIVERHRVLYEKAERDLHNYLTNVKVQLRSLQRIIEFGEFSNCPTTIEVESKARPFPVNSRRKVVLSGFFGSLFFSLFLVLVINYFSGENKG